MKKNTYIEPSVEVEGMENEDFICASDSITSSGVEGITYGGVDEEGTMDPASRRSNTVWDDEEM